MIAGLARTREITAVPFDGVTWQTPIEQQEPEPWDVLIVGAGPAGSMAAGHLARRGYRVLFVDRCKFPRDKTCGDALIPDALHALQRASLLPEVEQVGHKLTQASVFSPSRIEVPVPGQFLTLKRRVLDCLMARWAVEQGAFFSHGSVEDIEPEGGGQVSFRMEGVLKTFRARVAVLAVGARVALLKKLGMVKQVAPSALAVRCYLTSPRRIDRLIISYDRSIVPGYAWIFPLGRNEYNVGCGIFYRTMKNKTVNLREMFSRFVGGFPLARDLFEHKMSVTPLAGAPLRCSLSGAQVAGSGTIIAIGETIGATFPATGEGIGKAMETAELAVEAIDQTFRSGSLKPLQRLPHMVRSELMPLYRGYQIAEHWLSYPWLNDLVAWRAKQSRLLQRLASGMIAETVDPRKIFSIRGIFKSLWK